MPMRNELPDAAIKHVVVLMLENRGFDHIMGWLYPAVQPEQAAPYLVNSYDGDDRPFIGLSTLSGPQLQALANKVPGSDDTLPINRGARSPKSPSYNTGESFEHIYNQMWGQALNEAVWFDRAQRERKLRELSNNGVTPPPMTGYVLDYDMDVFHHAKKHLGRNDLSEVLDTYLPQQMPVLSGLARSYAVSDEWFCSVPSQTNTNRAFSVAGTSRGMVNNSFYDPPTYNPSVAIFKKFAGGKSHADSLPVSTRSLFEVLEEASLSWKVYWQSEWPPKALTLGIEWQYTRTMLPLLQNSQFDNNFVKFDANDLMSAFYRDARQGTLPAVSWIEPKWGGGAEWNSVKRGVGNDYHPVSDTTVGEDFVMNVYQALAAGPNWDNTLLIITFDENGGTYDHVAPPGSTPAPQADPQEGAPPPPPVPPIVPPPGNEANPLPRPPIDRGDMDPDTRTQYGYKFDSMGIRVPTLLVSPRIPAGTIFRSSEEGSWFDHTSMIATILKLGKVPKTDWMLGERVGNAPTFEGLIIQPPPPPEDGGQVQPEVLNRPARPLSIADGRSNDADLVFNKRYLLQYVGDPWWEHPGPVYMARSSSGLIPTYYYPTLTTDPAQAQAFTFRATGGGEELAPITNMSVLRIATTEASVMGWVLMTVSHVNSCVYYSGDRNNNSAWQVRLLGSRERADQIKENDLVYFVSQMSTITDDPMQRLLPYPRDMSYVTTRAGEWALWKVIPAPQAPIGV